MKDLRIYYYYGGQLLKIGYGNRFHKARSEKEARNNIVKWVKENREYIDVQFVIVECLKFHQSKIIDVLEVV